MIGVAAKQGDLQGVAAGSRAQQQIITNGLHYGLYLRAVDNAGVSLTAAQIASEIDRVEITINGDIKVQLSGEQLRLLWQHYTPGVTCPDGIIPWMWYRRNLDLFASRITYGIGMANVTSYQVNVDINPAAVTVDSIRCWVDYDPRAPRTEFGTHVTCLAYPRQITGTGEREESDLPYGDPASALLALHIYQSADALPDYLTARANSYEVATRVDTDVLETIQHGVMHAPQTNLRSLHFDSGNTIGSYLAFFGINDFRVTEQWSAVPAPAQIEYLYELVKGIKIKP